MLEAVDGEIEAIIPQFVVFEISYVFQTMYGATAPSPNHTRRVRCPDL